MVLKCKICGGDLEYQAGNRIATCIYCGGQQTLPPAVPDEKAAALYQRANDYRIANEFDKAANIYEQMIAADPHNGEAYWNLALCNYGVVYVQDPKTKEYVPTCNRTHYLPILKDQNYLKALENATPEQAAIYEKDAAYINEVQKGIVAIAKKEKPFDIFICYKETAADGTRSTDSIKAQALYEKLTAEGYKVFFSRITLESMVGSEYEPYIYAALASSKVMLHITTCRAHSEAVWVKNEWSRYLGLRQADSFKTLIPVCCGMDPADLPEEFAFLPAYDMEKEDFEQELLRGIKKLIPLPIMLAQKRKKLRKTFGIAGIVAAAVLLIGGLISIPFIQKQLKYDDAMALFNEKKYVEASAAFGELGNYRDAAEMVDTSLKQKDYEAAEALLAERKYPEAAWAFGKLSGYKEADAKKAAAELSWRRLLASVVAHDADDFEYGRYFITPNGTVENDATSPGTLHKTVSIEKNGRAVSITGGFHQLHALFENGAMTDTDAGLSQYTDLIKLDGISNGVSVDPVLIGLRANGTLVYGEPSGTNNLAIDPDIWAKTAGTWTDLVDFDCSGWAGTVIVGVRADGTLCYYYNSYDYYQEESETIAAQLEWAIPYFTNVRAVAVFPDDAGLILRAVTNDGKLLSFEDGLVKEEGEGYCDVSVNYALKRNGDLMQDGFVQRYDVVQARSNVTRSGSPEDSEEKTVVYDEWLARMN